MRFWKKYIWTIQRIDRMRCQSVPDNQNFELQKQTVDLTKSSKPNNNKENFCSTKLDQTNPAPWQKLHKIRPNPGDLIIFLYEPALRRSAGMIFAILRSFACILHGFRSLRLTARRALRSAVIPAWLSGSAPSTHSGSALRLANTKRFLQSQKWMKWQVLTNTGSDKKNEEQIDANTTYN